MFDPSPRQLFYAARGAIAPATAAATPASARAATAAAAAAADAAATPARATAHVAASVSPDENASAAVVRACRKGADALTIFLYVSIAAVLITLIVLLAIPGIIIPKKQPAGCVDKRKVRREAAAERRARAAQEAEAVRSMMQAQAQPQHHHQAASALLAPGPVLMRSAAAPTTGKHVMPKYGAMHCVRVRSTAGSAAPHQQQSHHATHSSKPDNEANLMVGNVRCPPNSWSGQIGSVAMGPQAQAHAASAYMNGSGGSAAAPLRAPSAAVGRPGQMVRDMVVAGPDITQIPPTQAFPYLPQNVAWPKPFTGEPYLGANPASVLQKGSFNPNAPQSCGGSGVQGSMQALAASPYVTRSSNCKPNAPAILATPGAQTPAASATAMLPAVAAPPRSDFPPNTLLMASGFPINPAAGVRRAAGTSTAASQRIPIHDTRSLQTTCARSQANEQAGIANLRAERERSAADLRRSVGMSNAMAPHRMTGSAPQRGMHENSDDKVSADDVESMFAQGVFAPGVVVVVAVVQDWCGYCTKAKKALSKGNRKMHGGALADESRVMIVFVDGNSLHSDAHKAKYSSANGAVPHFVIADSKGNKKGSVLGFDLQRLQQECAKHMK